MFGRLKNLFSKRGDGPLAAETPAATSPAPAAQAPAVKEATIDLPLKSVISRLPHALQSKIAKPPRAGVNLAISLRQVLEQLPQGSVKISFDELRRAAPPGTFDDSMDQDATMISLPLQDILPKLSPEHLKRRPDQKRIEVPADVAPLFGSRGEPLPQPRASAVEPPSPPTPAPSTPAQARVVAEPVKPAAPAQPAAASTAPALPTSPKPAAPAPQPSAPAPPTPSAPIKPQIPLPTPTALKPATPPASAPTAPVSQKVSVPAPAPATPVAPETRFLSVPLSQLIGTWPEPIKQALGKLNTSSASVELPFNEVDQKFKRGKIDFPWKQLRSWIKPSPAPNAAADQDETLVELALPVIAPLFLAQQRPAKTQRKIAIADNIPNLFTGKPAAAPLAPAPASPPSAAAPTAPATAPVPTMPAVPKPVAPAPATPAPAPAPKPALGIGDMFGQPGKRDWTPVEIAQKTSVLRGVAGALIATPDGLLVAAQMPPGLSGETIAAFVPQMFERMTQYTKELKFKETDNLTVIVDYVPLQIFKTGKLYFAVLGRASETLPQPQLKIIAAALGPQIK